MQNGSKSAGVTTRLSFALKLLAQFRKYPALTDTPGRSWCCTSAERSHIAERAPKPLTTSSAKRVTILGCPKSWAENAPHSPLATGLVRSQFGMKSPLVSFHVRSTVFTDVLNGLKSAVVGMFEASTYRPRDSLRAVRPSPNRSYAAPNRGLKSVSAGALFTGP